LIDFAGGPGGIRTVSYYQALDREKYLPADTFANKLVIVGVNTTSSAMPDERRPDHFPIPYTRWGAGYAPGSIVHANIAANLLSGSFITAGSLSLTALTGFLIAIAFGIGTLNLEFRQSSLIALLSGVTILISSFVAFVNANYYLAPGPLLLPLLITFLISPYYRYLAEARQRAFIRKAFSTYVNPVIVSELEKNPESVRLGGKQVDGTALFLDIAGFTALSERHSPETIVAFINEFLSRLIEIAMKHEGTVERFLGDAIMVIWGAPLEQSDHAQRASRAGIEMAMEVERLSATESARLGATTWACSPEW